MAFLQIVIGGAAITLCSTRELEYLSRIKGYKKCVNDCGSVEIDFK